MSEASDAQGIFYQNLIDAGCDQETIKRCIALVQEQNKDELLRLLSCHRNNLLEAVHCNHKKIDCLDFLVYQMNKHI